jgi:hypothetical protein
MTKPNTFAGYSPDHTQDCERVLVTLLRGLGPWKDSVYLIGGLTPRYLVPARPPEVPAHTATLDVDVLVDLQLLANTEAYLSLEQNLKRLGFERGENDARQKVGWRWQARTEKGALMVVELLSDTPDLAGGKVKPLPTQDRLSTLNIPKASIVFDLHQEREIRAELLGGNGVASVKVKHADLVAFTCLKAFAFEDRGERKDAHDLVYCVEHAPDGLDAVATRFIAALGGKHATVIREALAVLSRRFANDEKTEGYRKDGPVAVARFEIGEDLEPSQVELRALRQRQTNNVIERLLKMLG